MANDDVFFALRDALRTLRDLLPQLSSEVLGSERGGKRKAPSVELRAWQSGGGNHSLLMANRHSG